jgi:DNA-binding GntR family transcriptional regulator
VLAGELPSGAQLREAELSNAFGVGRHSLRAALQALVYEGLLRHEPNRGVFVPEFSSADVRDLFLLRIAIETHTARLLAERRTLIPEAISAVERLEALQGDEPWNEVTDLDLEFHRSLVEALDSPRVAKTFGSLQAELRLLLAQLRYQYIRPDKIGVEHRLVLDGILSRRPAHATRAMHEHLEVGIDDILEALNAAPKADSKKTSSARSPRRTLGTVPEGA